MDSTFREFVRDVPRKRPPLSLPVRNVEEIPLYDLKVTNAIGILNVDNYLAKTIESINLIWIGQISEASLLFLQSINKTNIVANVNYWIDSNLTSIDELSKIIKTLNIKSTINIKIKDIHSLSNFSYLDEIYPKLIYQKKFNYIKEVISLMVLNEYGGYYFDTTTEIETDIGELFALPTFSGLLIISNKGLEDVYFYYSNKNEKCKIITRWLLLTIINIYYLVFIYYPEKAISFDKFKQVIPLKEYTSDTIINDKLLYLLYRTSKGHCSGDFNIGFFYQEENTLTLHVRCILPMIPSIDPRLNVVGRINTIKLFEKQPPNMTYYKLAKNITFVKWFGKSGWQKKH